MDYFEFVDGLFGDQPSVLALRLSLVVLGEGYEGEGSILWFVRDDDAAVCLAGSMAARFAGHPSRVARDIANEHAKSGRKLLAEKSVSVESRRMGACPPGRVERLRGSFVSDGPYLLAMDLEQGLASVEGDMDEVGAGTNVRVLMAGYSLEGTFDRSVWLAAFCGDTCGPLDADLLFRYLATYYPIRFHRTPYHRWNREFGDQYWSGLPWLKNRFLGALGPNPLRSGDPLTNIFWSKKRSSPLPAWRDVCKRGTDDLLAELRRRLSDLDRRSGGRIGPEPLIEWLDAKGRGAAGSELDCAAVLCAANTLARIDRIWLPVLCLLWRRDHLETAQDLESAITVLTGHNAPDFWREYAKVGHAGYVIQAVIELREALSRIAGGHVSESIRYRAADAAMVQTIEISGIDPPIAKTLAAQIVDGRPREHGLDGGIRLGGEPGTQVSSDLVRALRDLRDSERGGIGDVAAEYIPVRSVLRMVISFELGSVR